MDDLITLGGVDVTLRPMRAGDATMHEAFIASLEPDDLRYRFGTRVEDVSHAERHRVTKVDHQWETTFVATVEAGGGDREIVGEVRTREDASGERAEFAIAVRSDRHRRGLGRALLEKIIEFCRVRNVRLLFGLVDPSNTAMLALARRLGFDIDHVPGGARVVVSLEL